MSRIVQLTIAVSVLTVSPLGAREIPMLKRQAVDLRDTKLKLTPRPLLVDTLSRGQPQTYTIENPSTALLVLVGAGVGAALGAGACLTIAIDNCFPLGPVIGAGVSSLIGLTYGVTKGDLRPCFRGRPLRGCGVFAITEAGYRYQLTPRAGPRHLVDVELGFMMNFNQTMAWGGTAFIAGNFDGESRWGLKGRYRYWLSRWASVEAGAGVLYVTEIAGLDPSGPAFTGQLAFNMADFGSVTGTVDAFGRGDTRWSVGAKTGSYSTAVAAGLALVALVVAIVIECSNTEYCFGT